MDDPQWGKSVLSSLQNCSWQWWLEQNRYIPHETTPHAAVGTALHAGFEAHELARLEGELLDFEGFELVSLAALEVELREVSDEVWDRQPDDLDPYEWMAWLTHNWWNAPTKTEGKSLREIILDYTPILVEREMSEPRYPRALRGRVDWIGRNPEGVMTCVDLKTAGSFTDWRNPEVRALEASVYVRLCEKAAAVNAGEGDVRMEWHVVRRGQGKTKKYEAARMLVLDLTNDHRKRLESVLEWADGLVDSDGPWLRNPDWHLCSPRWCAAYGECMGGGGTLTPQTLHPRTAEAEGNTKESK